MLKDAEKKSAGLLKDAEQRLEQIRVERESVADYIANLRGVLDSADRAAADHGFPTVAPEPVTAATQVVETPGDRSGDDGIDEQTREREHAN
jgi:hypothetical protein